MSLNSTMTSLMDKVREVEMQSNKLSLADLQLFLDSLTDLKFHKGWELWGADLQTTRNTGIYYCHDAVLQKPTPGDGFLFVISPGNNGWNHGIATQYFIDISNKTMYKRMMNTAYTWSSWKQVGGS